MVHVKQNEVLVTKRNCYCSRGLRITSIWCSLRIKPNITNRLPAYDQDAERGTDYWRPLLFSLRWNLGDIVTINTEDPTIKFPDNEFQKQTWGAKCTDTNLDVMEMDGEHSASKTKLSVPDMETPRGENVTCPIWDPAPECNTWCHIPDWLDLSTIVATRTINQ